MKWPVVTTLKIAGQFPARSKRFLKQRPYGLWIPPSCLLKRQRRSFTWGQNSSPSSREVRNECRFASTAPNAGAASYLLLFYFPVKSHPITKKYKLHEVKVSEEKTSCCGLHRVEMGCVADVSEERATSIWTVAVCKIKMWCHFQTVDPRTTNSHGKEYC